jgi:hypothetical protein
LGSRAIQEQKAAVARQGRRQKWVLTILVVFTAVNLLIFALQIGLGFAFQNVSDVVNRQETAAKYQRKSSQANRCVTGAQSGALLALTDDLVIINKILLDPETRLRIADPDSEEAKAVALAQGRIDQAQPVLRSIYEDSLKPEEERTGGDCPIPQVPKVLQNS